MAGPMAPPAPPKVPPAPTNGPVATTAATTAAAVKKPTRLARRAIGNRIVLIGVEGVGKTSLVACAPNPLIVMAGNETGYETLMNNHRVPEVDVLHAHRWTDLLASLEAVAADTENAYDVIGLDAIGGIERLCHEHICETQFNGVWGEKGFTGYQRGYDVSVTQWLRLLHILDKMKERGTHVVFLSHCQVRPFKNPLGDDFDQYKADVHHKTWAATHRWSDAALFMNFLTDVQKVDGSAKKKGVGGTTRMLYTERRDAFDAKNRFGMPEMIQLPDDPNQMWATVDYYMTANKKES